MKAVKETSPTLFGAEPMNEFTRHLQDNPIQRPSKRWYVYHARLSCRAARPLLVRPYEWIRQTVVMGEEAAADVARTIARQGVHAKITSRQGTRLFMAR